VKILIIGGTSFVGRAISWSAWHHGHEVSVLNRGVTADDLPETVERLRGDRQGDLSVLGGRHFDATVDVIAYRPSDVARLADALGDRGGHYVQISSISAYHDADAEGGTEATLTLWDDETDVDAPVTPKTYGPLKAACERAGWRAFGEDSTMVRPTYVIGAFDATLRFPYWVERIRRGGTVAVPGPGTNAFQYVDARDLANFAVRVIEEPFAGAVHVAGPTPPDHFGHAMEVVAATFAPSDTTLVEVSAERISDAGLEDKFPLWSGAATENLMALDCSLALSLGFDARPLSDSVEDVLEWWGERTWPERWLAAADEARLLAG
jgi:2'-hydroxyisoflavone reductase